VAVFEVIGPSTARTDRIVKNQEYRDTPSVQYYVMLEQDFAGAMVFSRLIVIYHHDRAWHTATKGWFDSAQARRPAALLRIDAGADEADRRSAAR
jgi:hypothetical protein